MNFKGISKLIEWFYDEKAKELHELRLGFLDMHEYITRFTSLLWYVPYILEEKSKVQRFLSSIPMFMKERTEFESLKTMDEAIRKARNFYQQTRQKGDTNKNWS